MTLLLTSAHMRALEAAAPRPGRALMEDAGRQAAAAIAELGAAGDYRRRDQDMLLY